jgi:hypothetical protein
MNKVFLGGTCNESTWRKDLEKMLNGYINYFNPVVDDWNEDAQTEEIRQKDEVCNIHLYVITPKMTGVFSIAEAVESCFKEGKKCIFSYLEKDGEDHFDDRQIRSLNAVGKLVKRNGGTWVKGGLNAIADFLTHEV